MKLFASFRCSSNRQYQMRINWNFDILHNCKIQHFKRFSLNVAVFCCCCRCCFVSTSKNIHDVSSRVNALKCFDSNRSNNLFAQYFHQAKLFDFEIHLHEGYLVPSLAKTKPHHFQWAWRLPFCANDSHFTCLNSKSCHSEAFTATVSARFNCNNIVQKLCTRSIIPIDDKQRASNRFALIQNWCHWRIQTKCLIEHFPLPRCTIQL